MACYKIELKTTAEKSLANLPKTVIKKIVDLIGKLAGNPYPSGHKKPISSDHTYRIRSGDYRIVYSVFDESLIIHIIKIGHRKDVYK
jgi:mRNA interferase RelE/StbE